MKTKLLFPYHFRFIGWGLILTTLSFYGYARFDGDGDGWEFGFLTIHIEQELLAKWFDSHSINFTDELVCLSLISGLLFIGFSREKVEDEMIRQIRLEALQASVYLNYFLLALAIIFIHGLSFFDVMIYNMFTVLLVFFIRFQLALRKSRQVSEPLLSL